MLNASHGRDASNSMYDVGKPTIAGRPVTEQTPGTAGTSVTTENEQVL